MIVLSKDFTTNPDHGKHPDSRSLEERLASGFILLDKPKGPTSHQVSAWVRDLLGMDKLGHGGTLDPFATGVLPLLCGNVMRLTSKVLTHNKTYIAVLRMSREFTTDELENAMNRLRGKIFNVPPEISAVKVQVRTRTIHEFSVLDDSENLIIVKITCEAGTYVRTMARDLGLLMNQKVDLVELRRESSGDFKLEHCVTLQEVADAIYLWKEKGDESAMLRIVHPVEKIVQDLPAIYVKDSAAAALSHGAPLLRPGIVKVPTGWTKGSNVALFTCKNELVAIAELLCDTASIKAMSEGEIAKPSSVIMKADTYPRMWTKSE